MTCSWTSSAVIGLNVPMPTCRVIEATSAPRGADAFESLVGEVQAGGRSGDRARVAREDGLIGGAILELVCRGRGDGPPDVGRQRQMPEALEVGFDRFIETNRAPAVRVVQPLDEGSTESWRRTRRATPPGPFLPA